MDTTSTNLEETGLWSRRGAAHISCAHRGFSARHPENTVSAIEAAIPHADYVEVDVRTTADRAVVVMHDKTPERTTDVAARWPQRRADLIDTFTLAELRGLDAGSWFGAGAPSAAVSSLHEVLEVVAGTPCGVLVEVKSADPAAVVDVVTDFRRGHPDTHVALGSVEPEVARGLAALVVDVPVGVLFVDQDRLTAAQLSDHASFASFLGFRNDRLTEDTISRVHRAGPQAMHNTNTRSAIEAMVAGGADATMSDDPSLVGDVVAGRVVTVVEAESLIGSTDGNAAVQRAEHRVPYKLSDRAAAVVTAPADGDAATFPLGELPAGQLVCRLGSGPWGGRFTVTLDDGLAVPVDTSSRSPARRDVVVGDVVGPGEHWLHVSRIQPTRGGDTSGGDTVELVLDSIEVRTTAAR